MHALAPSSCHFESLEELNQPNLRADQYYERSKLAIILYTKALVTHASLKADEVVVLSVHPGAVSTEIQDQFQQAFGETLGKVIKYLQTPLMRSPEEGSLGTLWCAVSPEVEEMMRGGEGGEGTLGQGAYVTDPGKVRLLHSSHLFVRFSLTLFAGWWGDGAGAGYAARGERVELVREAREGEVRRGGDVQVG